MLTLNKTIQDEFTITVESLRRMKHDMQTFFLTQYKMLAAKVANILFLQYIKTSTGDHLVLWIVQLKM